MQGNLNAIGEVCHHPLFIQGNNLDFRVRKIFREESAAGSKGIVSVGNGEARRKDSDFKNIARRGSLDEDWAGEDVSTGAFVLHPLVDVAEGLLDLIGRNAGFFEALWAAGDQGWISTVSPDFMRRTGAVLAS